MPTLSFNVIPLQGAPAAADVDIERVVIAGWAGRDPAAQGPIWSLSKFITGLAVARLVADTLEVVADTRGEVTLVLTVGGPHIELRLGCGQPTVFASWGGEQATCPVFLDPDVLEDEVGAWWQAAMAQSMSNPPYEG